MLHPLCSKCLYTKATDVHHVEPLKRNGDPYDVLNMMALCKSCHSRESVLTGERFGTEVRVAG